MHNVLSRGEKILSMEESSASREVLKPIYFFDEHVSAGRRLLGGKGVGLAEMTKLGLPVPAGFTITTEICEKYYEAGRRLPDGLMDEVRKSMKRLESITGRRFGGPNEPLLVSVRSGSAASMPGMLDTVLNLGLNEELVVALAKGSGDSRFAYDVYRRLLQMYGKIVLGIEDRKFESILAGKDLSDPEVLRSISTSFKSICNRTSRGFPEDPYRQLETAIDSVFKSWMGKRAIEFRRQYGITPATANGTAVSVVAMVFGNMGNDSGTGVVFTRNPESGEKKLYGDYLLNAQGEDVVSGKVNPSHIDSLEREMPPVFAELRKVCEKLEAHFREPQDVEFTIERGRLYVLQTRKARMNAVASLKTSVDLFHEGLISRAAALERIDPEGLEQVLYSRLSASSEGGSEFRPFAVGVGASPGVASGVVIFDVGKAEQLGRKGEKVILVREETKPDDVPAFFQSAGILTGRGGKTSHAAVLARGMGKPCVVGCTQIEINFDKSLLLYDDGQAGVNSIAEGQKITIDGSTGKIYAGEVPTVESETPPEFNEILLWSSEMKGIKIRANADTPESAALAKKYGAEGIGLCRTERMFNQHDRAPLFVKMIMAENLEEKRKALAQLEPLQKADFKAIFTEMSGLPVTIRLLDPPLHEFLPEEEELLQQIFELKSSGSPESRIRELENILHRAHELSEVNPMLGHRGVRMGISFPEIYESQIRAVCEAAVELELEGVPVDAEIMVPQISLVEELSVVKQVFETTKREVENKHGMKLRIAFGSMIEVVRACFIADEITQMVDFLSFGTNDLTQSTFSFSREDAEGKFLPQYIDKGVITANPFQTLDQKGVGGLMKLAVQLARSIKKDIPIGICGEHGGDPKSIEFCSSAGLDYVSASAHRIPIAIVAAAQSAIRHNKRHTLLKD
jgi:pyruvate,orthophosphate dikinase